MKIGLIIPANIKYSPYVNYYTDVLKKAKVDYRLMVWDKTGAPETADMLFPFHASDFDRKKILIGHYLFSKKCKQYIRKEQISHIIVFTIAPLFFLGSRFLSGFKGKMIIDVRDDSPFRRRFPNRLDRMSRMAHTLVVSSPRFAEWFSRESILSHNADLYMLEKYDDSFSKEGFSDPVRIVFAGMMIEEEINIQLVRHLADQPAFKLVFIGRDNEPKDKIKRVVNENGIGNVDFEGEYRKDDIVDIYREKADLVNIVRQKTLVNRNALPNKFYDAVISGIPLVVYDHNEAISDYVKQFGLGIVLNEQDEIKDQLVQGLRTFDYGRFREGRREFLDLVRKDYARFEARLKSFCQEK